MNIFLTGKCASWKKYYPEQVYFQSSGFEDWRFQYPD